MGSVQNNYLPIPPLNYAPRDFPQTTFSLCLKRWGDSKEYLPLGTGKLRACLL